MSDIWFYLLGAPVGALGLYVGLRLNSFMAGLGVVVVISLSLGYLVEVIVND